MTTPLGEPETVEELIAKISRTVQGSVVEPRTWLTSSITDSQTTITVTEAREEIIVGKVLCVDLEQMRVKEVNGTSLTVERAYTGTPAAAHDSGALVQVGWSDPYSEIAAAMVAEIRSWSSEIFQVRTATVSISDNGYAAATLTDYLQVLSASMSDGRGTRDVTSSVDVLPSAPGFTGGSAVRLRSYRSAGTLTLTYASRFGDLSTAALDDDLVTDLALPPRVFDIVEYGTAWRLLSGGETQRLALDNQGEPRKADEVRALQRMQGGLANKQLRDERLAEEAMELRKIYPVRF